MKIEHLALWIEDLEMMKDWYCQSFAMTAGEKYKNSVKGFQSYFLSF
jgi:lactoylglutathione lyase